MKNITITVNLKNDLENYLREKLQKNNLNKLGVDISAEEFSKLENENLDNLIMLYSKLRNRLLIGQKKKVILHKSLLHQFKYSRYKTSILKLKKIFENGKSIRPYLSNQVNKIYFEDRLLLDWGIHHLHFTSCYSNKKRGNDILFIIEQDNIVHFIAIMTHADFYNVDLLKYTYENCPAILEPYKLVGLEPLPQNYTEQQIKKLRNYDVAYCISFDENVYAPSLNIKSNISLIQARFQLYKMLEFIEKSISIQEDVIIKQLDNNGINESIHFKWIINKDSLKLQLYDSKTKGMCLFDCLKAPNPIIILNRLNII